MAEESVLMARKGAWEYEIAVPWRHLSFTAPLSSAVDSLQNSVSPAAATLADVMQPILGPQWLPNSRFEITLGLETSRVTSVCTTLFEVGINKVLASCNCAGAEQEIGRGLRSVLAS